MRYIEKWGGGGGGWEGGRVGGWKGGRAAREGGRVAPAAGRGRTRPARCDTAPADRQKGTLALAREEALGAREHAGDLRFEVLTNGVEQSSSNLAALTLEQVCKLPAPTPLWALALL